MHRTPHEREITLAEEIRKHHVPFFIVFLGVFFVSYAFLYSIDFLPEDPNARKHEDPNVAVVDPEMTEPRERDVKPRTQPTTPVTKPTTPEKPTTTSGGEQPNKIVFESLGHSVTVLNPTKSDVATLDNALLSGAVRYPGSADFTNEGTMVIMGHSSYLPTVHNKNFQAFNGIQKLKWGDVIRVESNNREYLYRVQRVYEAKASTTEVPLQWDTPELILVTCNSFGTKEDRFIVEARFIESREI